MRALIKLLFEDEDLNIIKVREDIENYFESRLKSKLIKDERNFEWRIEKVECTHVDIDNKFFSIDVYLNDYNSQDYFLYYDNIFIKNIDEKIKGFYVDFSEQGLQGPNFVNLDVSI